jgi:protein disulfide isomerase
MIQSQLNFLKLFTFNLILLNSLAFIYNSSNINHDLFKINPTQIKIEPEVSLAISSSNYDKLIESHENLLIFFYYKPCPLCKQIFPEIKKAEEILHSNFPPNFISVGTVNSSDKENEILLRRLQISKTNYQLKLISKGIPMDYSGGRSAEDMVLWFKNTLSIQAHITEVKSSQEMEDIRNYKNIVAIFFGNQNNKMFKNFITVANAIELNFIYPPQFFKCSNCLDFYKVKEGNIILYKNISNLIEEEKSEFLFTNYKSTELMEFFLENLKPSVMKFDFITVKYIFEKKIMPGLFIYRSKEIVNSGDDQYNNILLKISKKIKGKLQPVITDIVEPAEKKLSNMIGIKDKHLPLVMIHDSREELKSYKMENSSGEITEENILQFVNDWLNNKLKQYVKSEVEPEKLIETNNGVYTLVGDTLERYVMQKSKDVIVMFYAPWCKYSKEFLPIYENVSKKITKDSNENKEIIFAKFDAFNNDNLLVKVDRLPKIVLWPSGENKKPIFYEEFDKIEENFTKFLKDNITNKILDFNDDLDKIKIQINKKEEI